jgi:uncharacterized protein (DUF2267 family)
MTEKNKYRFKTLEDVRRFLSKITNELNANKEADGQQVTRYRALGYLANTLIEAIKSGDIDERLKAIETKFNEMGKL